MPIESELGQPFFEWLSARTGADGREIGVAGAMRLASPRSAEDAEVLRAHAAAFIAERFPAGGGPDPAPGRSGYEQAREGLRETAPELRRRLVGLVGIGARTGARRRDLGPGGRR